MSESPNPLSVEQRGAVRVLTLNRPKVHNAFNGDLIEALIAELQSAETDDETRVVVIAGRGRSFCAGADLAWMRKVAGAGQDSSHLARLFDTIDGFPKPTVGRVHGSAIGGGVGLVCCLDIVVASERAKFALSEVRLGLAPAVISPYVLSRLSTSAARRYFLTGERFSSSVAQQYGMVHEVVPEADLDEALAPIIENLLLAGPEALKAAKELIREVPRLRHDREGTLEYTAGVIGRLRKGTEGQEGMMAFLQKRPAAYVRPFEGLGSLTEAGD